MLERSSTHRVRRKEKELKNEAEAGVQGMIPPAQYSKPEAQHS